MTERPAWYGGNKIPASYRREIDRRYYQSIGKQPDRTQDDLPIELRSFVAAL